MQAVTVIAQSWGHMWGGSPGWMWLIMPLVWLAVIITIVVVVRALNGPSPDRSRRESDDPALRPRIILAERLARGEIDRDEYRERLEALDTGA